MENSFAARWEDPAGRTIRVPGPHERGRFATDAWGHLLALGRAGVLDAAELELVIERAMAHVEGRISLADLRALLGDQGDASGPGLADDMTVH